jgi:hypothetical protein
VAERFRERQGKVLVALQVAALIAGTVSSVRFPTLNVWVGW